MEKNPKAWGLDIGHSSIKAVLLSRNGADVEVESYAIEPIETGDNVDRETAVLKALQNLTSREAFGQTPVVASLSGRQIFSRTINIPVLNPKRVAKMVELEARQQIPGDFNDVEWAYHLSPAADGASNDVAIFAARKELITDLVGKCKRVGVNLIGVSVSSLALYNFVRYDQEFGSDETVAILDVGAENTDLVLYQGDTLWMRTLSAAGNDITKALMKKFKVSFEEAEQLKRQLGDSQQADRAFKLIEVTLNELVSEVTRSLGFYKGQNKSAHLENMVISGNTFRLPNLDRYLADRLRMAMISLEDVERIKVVPGLDRTHFLVDLQSLAVAMGLSLQGTGVAAANVNLMSTHARLEQLLKTKRWAAVVALVLLVIALVVNNIYTQSRIDENLDLAQKMQAAIRDNTTRGEGAQELLKTVGPLAERLDAFGQYGRHKGLNLAVHQGVIKAVSEAITSYGKVEYAPPAEVATGDDILQRVYLHRIHVPPFDFIPDPFRPLQAPRLVEVEILIVREDKDETLRLSQEVLEMLKSIPAPEGMDNILGGKALFSDVQNRASPSAEVRYWYKDDNFLGPSGNVQKLEKEIPIKAAKVIYVCTLANANIAPTPVVGAEGQP